MSEDDYFSDNFDSAMLDELDAIEAAAQARFSQPNHSSKPVNSRATSGRYSKEPLKPQSKSIQSRPQPKKQTSSSDYDISFNVDASELEKLDAFIADSYAGLVQPIAGPSKTVQTTLDGKVLSPSTTKSQSKGTFERSTSSSRGPLFGYAEKRTKQWDHSAFSATGWKSTKGRKADKGKGKTKAEEEELEEERIEFEQFPNMDVGPPPEMRLKPDMLSARDWIYPTNKPRRDYQFNIAKKCLFHNTLVALPTGLGKTFIAGVVMLNYYTWFPKGKVIFVAPTKPLVAQQISACHDVCGIPGHDAVELTGDIPKHRRSAAWVNKRVLYMTPQTLVNDLASGVGDPLDIVLIVIDEAHRGTGDYAYAQIIRFMMAKNPHFRVLALSATPGNTPDAVQAIVDSLHISHIEIRNEQSFDLRSYIHKKEIKVHVIRFDEFISMLRDLLAKIMDPIFTQLRSKGLINAQSSVTLKPFSCQCALKVIFERKEMWAIGPMKYLGDLSRAMGNLLECTAMDCYDTLVSIREKLVEGTKKTDQNMRDKILKNPSFIKLMQELEARSKIGFPPHPKMDALVQIILQHFADETPVPNGSKETSDSKIMVFVQYRNAVMQLCDLLNTHSPMVRATRFVGQGKDKKGRKGMLQSDQIDAIRRFKEGEFNVLVSTSIGEEGLDIGEIDRIICYDAQNNPTRMLQRVGRTGRKRTGYVDVLLAEEREERNWDKSKENYEDVQNVIINGNQLELYSDVERLLPEGIDPVCIQREMIIEPYVPVTKGSSRNSPTRGKKVKRNNDINRNIPLGALTGFVTASELRPKKSRAKKATKEKGIRDIHSSDVEDDSIDEDIASGLQGKPKSKKSESEGKVKAPSRTLKDYLKEPVPSWLDDDDDDLDIGNGLKRITGKRKTARSSSSSSSSVSVEESGKRPRKYQKRALDALPDSMSSKTRPRKGANTKSGSSISKPPSGSVSTRKPSWLLGSSDSELSSAPKSKGSEVTKPMFTSAKAAAGTVLSTSSLEVADLPKSNAGFSKGSRKPSQIVEINSSPECVVNLSSSTGAMLGPVTPLRPLNIQEGNTTIELTTTPATPESSFVVCSKPAKRKRELLVVPPSSPDASEKDQDDQAAAPRRLVRRRQSPSPSLLMGPPPNPPARQKRDDNEEKKSKKPNRPKLKMKDNPMLFDIEAAHSGSSASEDNEGSEVDMIESDSDRLFLEEMDASQASPSYNQTAAYRMGLMTQAPSQGPQFASRPKRMGAFAGGRTQVSRPPGDWYRSSSPVDDEPDEYHMGSFVVADDDSILFDQSSEV